VNVAPAVRLLISNPDLDQRGTIVDVPGQLVDLLAGPSRPPIAFYVMRQDKRTRCLVFDGSNYGQIAALRTGTTPTGMSFTSDGQVADRGQHGFPASTRCSTWIASAPDPDSIACVALRADPWRNRMSGPS